MWKIQLHIKHFIIRDNALVSIRDGNRLQNCEAVNRNSFWPINLLLVLEYANLIWYACYYNFLRIVITNIKSTIEVFWLNVNQNMIWKLYLMKTFQPRCNFVVSSISQHKVQVCPLQAINLSLNHLVSF